MNDSQYTSPRSEEDVTQEMIDLVCSVVNAHYLEGRIDWPDVWDRIDGTVLNDGTTLDMGDELDTPAIKALKKVGRKSRS